MPGGRSQKGIKVIRMSSTKKDLLKKLSVLAERGVGGEKESARKKLNELMEKYGIDDAELSDEEKRLHTFKYRTAFERRLLIQIAAKINHEIMIYRTHQDKCLLMDCTNAEDVQLRIEFEFYRQLWKEEQDFLFTCFVQKHELFRNDPDAPKTAVDAETSLRMLSVMRGLQSGRPVPLLEAVCNRPSYI